MLSKICRYTRHTAISGMGEGGSQTVLSLSEIGSNTLGVIPKTSPNTGNIMHSFISEVVEGVCSLRESSEVEGGRGAGGLAMKEYFLKYLVI